MRYVLLLVIATGAIVTLATMLTQVQPGERAVVRRFGRLLDEKPGPGLYRGLPWGIDRVDRVPVGRVRRVVVGFDEKEEADPAVTPVGQLLTGDHNLVNVKAEIYYRVREADVERFVLLADRADALVARAAEAALAEWVAGRPVDEVILRGKVRLPAHLRDETQRRLDPYELGVEVEQASVTDLSPPAEVKAAFDRLAEAQTEIRTKVNRAEQAAQQKRSDAAAEVYRLKSSAAAYANEQVVQARAEADTFRKRLAQYQALAAADPSALNALWLDGMTRVYAKMKADGRVDVLDHYLSGEGLTITQFPLQRKK